VRQAEHGDESNESLHWRLLSVILITRPRQETPENYFSRPSPAARSALQNC
jgi:hypothetical protein